MPTIVWVALVILGTALVETLVDKALGIDFSSISSPKRIVHGVVYKLSGAAIAATIWFL